MTVFITAELLYNTETSMFKAAYFESFSSKTMKAKIFVL